MRALRDNVEPEDEAFPYAEEEDPPRLKAFNKKLAAKGWIAPSWAPEYGGMGLGPWTNSCLARKWLTPARCGGRGPAVGYAGPTIQMYGTEEQASPPAGITNWDVVWGQGFSEPGSGSDLASLPDHRRPRR